MSRGGSDTPTPATGGAPHRGTEATAPRSTTPEEPSRLRSSRGILAGLALASCALYGALSLGGDLRAALPAFLALHAAAYVLYLAAVRAVLKETPAWSVSAILIWAAVFRLILLPSTPWLSDDIWRYMWEGRLQWHGVNPYAHAPDDPALEHLRDGIYEKVNHRHLPAIYPPVTQWAMALGASAGPSVLAMKGIFVLAEAGVVLALLALLRRRGLPASRVLLYAWNPLAVVEVAGSGHNDPLGIAFLLAATAAIIGERPVMSMASLALSGLSKLFPWCLFLLFARRARAALLLLPGLALVCYLPYLGAGSGLFRSTRAYAESWRSNDVLFGLLVAAVNVTGLSPRLTTWMSAHGLENLYGQPHMIARVAAALILAAWMALLVRRQATHRLPVEKGIFLFTAAMLLLLPTLHPWYLLWILPWLCLYPSAAWLALAGLVPLGYQVSAWTRWVEFVPFYALLAVTALSRRRRGKPVIEWSP